MSARRILPLVSVVLFALMLFGAAPAVAGHGGGGGGGGGSSPTITAFGLNTATPPSGSSGFGLVELSASAPSGGVVVKLTSSNPNALPLPSSFTIGSGFSGSFDYTAGTVRAATSVTLTATLGSSSASTTVTVTPPSAATLFSLESLPSDVEGGQSVTLLPDLSAPAPAGGAVVSLTSSNPALAPVPATATIPAGSYLIQVTVPTSVVTAVTTVTFTATWNGSSISSQLQIVPINTPTAVSFSPSTTNGPNGSTGTVTVAETAPGNGTTVTLQSSNPAVASVPPTTTVQTLSNTTTFTVTTTPVTTNTPVTISATAGGGDRVGQVDARADASARACLASDHCQSGQHRRR